MAFPIRILFSAIGFAFILFFTARGIFQDVCILINYFDVSRDSSKNLSASISASINSLSPIFNNILFILGVLIMIHGVIGIYYAISTNYHIRKLLKEKAFFYLQIISAFGAVFVIMNLSTPSGNATAHTALFWIISLIIALLGAFHIGNGFFNACITLGICVSEQSKFITRIIAWIIAAISLLQIILFML